MSKAASLAELPGAVAKSNEQVMIEMLRRIESKVDALSQNGGGAKSTRVEKPRVKNDHGAVFDAVKEFLADGTARHNMEIARYVNSKLPFPVKEGSCATSCWKLAKEGAIENVRKGVYRIKMQTQE